MAHNDSGSQSGGRPLPHCKAMLLCEKVSESRINRALTLHSLIDVFQLSGFPNYSGPFAVFLQLYDGIGQYHLTLEISDLADDTSVSRTWLAELEFPERLAKIDVVVPIESVHLPRPGRYELVVLADSQELSRQYFRAETDYEREG